jgi:hypothetical protein
MFSARRHEVIPREKATIAAENILSIISYPILLKQESEFSRDFAGESSFCTWTIPRVTMVARWPMNLTI